MYIIDHRHAAILYTPFYFLPFDSVVVFVLFFAILYTPIYFVVVPFDNAFTAWSKYSFRDDKIPMTLK